MGRAGKDEGKRGGRKPTKTTLANLTFTNTRVTNCPEWRGETGA